MAPVLSHPSRASFVDEFGTKPINVDAAVYYGGGETYTRSRTYSHVSFSV
jgi:alpha,alpha-trehalase